MKPRTLHTALIAAAIVAALAAIGSRHAHADGKADSRAKHGVVTESRPVTAFSTISLNGPFHVTVTPGTTPAIELHGPRDKLAQIETVVSGGTLTVRQRVREGWSINFSLGKDQRPPLTVRISAVGLTMLRNTGSGDVELQQFSGAALNLVSSGPGDLTASGSVRELTVNLSGSGDLDLRALQAGNLDLISNGAGDLRAHTVTGDVSVAVSGSGDVDVDDLQGGKIHTVINGPGDVTLRGRARALQAELSGSGDLEACALAAGTARARLSGPGDACIAGPLTALDAELHGSGDLAVQGLQAQTVQLSLHGPGDARLEGKAARVIAQLHGAGDLNGKQLWTAQADIKVRGSGNAVLYVNDKADAARLLTYTRDGVRERSAD